MQKNFFALLHICAGPVLAAYSLQDEYNATNFFDNFDFFTGQDPTHGSVQYSSKDVAIEYNLIATKASTLPGQEGTNNTYIAAHDGAFNHSLDVSMSRPSVRLTSKQKYTHGLFIADIVHLPVAECGAWPAFWTTNLNGSWPAGGEIDIVEGVNTQTNNQISLHTGSAAKCAISSDTALFTGTVLESSECAVASNPSGCSIMDGQAMSYGEAFNAARGGVYAMQWTSGTINVYWWARRDIPQDVKGGSPDPSTWATPVASYSSASCDIDKLFQDHQIIFDITFCGDWAGQTAVWDQQCQTKYPGTCANYVMTSTDAFKKTYWEIASVKVYQDAARNVSKNASL